MVEKIKQSEGEEELLRRDSDIREEINQLLKRIKGETDLERIRRFVAYIYIHH